MAWSPEPEVADCRVIARKWGQEQIIIIGLDGRGQVKMATYGADKKLCDCAWALGQAAFGAVNDKIKEAINALKASKGRRPLTIEDPPEGAN